MAPAKRFDRVFLWFFITVSVILISKQFLFKPFIGLSDNGDFGRIRLWYGLLPQSDPFIGFVVEDFSFGQPAPFDYYSSELIFTQIAVVLSKLIGNGQSFDIRYLGIVHSFFLIVGLALFVNSFRQFGKAAYFAVGLASLVIFTDVRYVQYLNSFYNEPATFIATLFCIATFLSCLTSADSKEWLILYILFIFWGLVLTTSKNLNIPTGVIFGILGVGLVLQRFGLSNRRSKLLFLLPLLIFIASTLFPFLTITNYRRANLFDTIFNGVLLNSDMPEQDLAELNIINPEYVQYIGKSFWDVPREIRYLPQFTAEFDEFILAKTGYYQVTLFYFNHPDRFIKLIIRAINNSQLEDPFHGNFTQSSGLLARSKSTEFTVWSSFRQLAFWRSARTSLALFVMSVFLAGWIISRPKHPLDRYHAILFLALLMACYLQFVVVILGDGVVELSKHLIIYNFLSDLCLVIGLALAIPRIFPSILRVIQRLRILPALFQR